VQRTRRIFDVLSAYYRYTPLGFALRRVQRLAVNRLGIRPLERVLDIGSGPGDALRSIATMGGMGFGLDLSLEMLKNARRYLGRRAPLVCGQAENLPYADGSFDKIVCTNVFHHSADPLATLREMRRVLRKGGLLVLADPRPDHPASRLAVDIIERQLLGMKEVHLHTFEEWRTMLSEAGFTAADVRPGPIHRLTAYAEVFVEATT
jgi:ubiquinone/menaquinone biosynthesis C-methylase UbiE